MRYFITGATGFIGGHVARQLLDAGHHVVAIARVPSKALDLAQLGVEVHPGDVTERASLRKPMAGADGIFHIAGWYKVGSRDTTAGQAINVEGTRNVLETMRELGIAKGVYTSTLAINGDTHGVLADENYRSATPFLSEYDRTKWSAHREVAEPMRQAGLPLVVVMPGLVYGPGDTSQTGEALLQYLRRRLPLTPRGTAFSWGHVDDVARAHLLAMELGRAGEDYIVCGPTHQFIEGFEIAERLTGIKAPRLHPGPRTMRAMAAIMDGVGSVLPVPDSYRGESLRVIAGVTYIGNNAKAKYELGFDPRPLDVGLRETLAYDMRLLGMRVPATL